MNTALAYAHRANLVIDRLSKWYEGPGGRVEVVRDLSLEIAAGEFVVVVGPSGCGKSTLLSMIAGFERPSSGAITIDGEVVGGPGPDRLMMFQEHALFPWLNVIDNVGFGLASQGGPARRRREIARRFLRMVHLEGFERSLVHELSGGMKHRVALARSLAPDPKALLVDEPFSALDTVTKHHLYRELQEIFVSTRKTIVAVTHDTTEAAVLGDRVVALSSRPGRIRCIIPVSLPRPRKAEDKEVVEIAREITTILERG